MRSLPSASDVALLEQKVSSECAELLRLAPNLRDEIEQRQRQITAPEARLAFTGRFKVGKSTMVNAALCRSLLPMNDLPETGVVCHLRAGTRDVAFVTEGGRRREIPCTMEALRQELSLLDDQGGRRASLDKDKTIEITLGGGLACPIPADACWIDSPGFDDTEQMDARAQSAQNDTDILLWVLNSQTNQYSESDAIRLADYVEANGEAGVILLFNVRLPVDTVAAWTAFEERNMLRLQQRIRDRQAESGFAVEPRTIFVSARAIGGDGNRTANPLHTMTHFGGTDLWSFLRQIQSGAHPLVRTARLERLQKYITRKRQSLAESPAPGSARTEPGKLPPVRRRPTIDLP